MIVNKSAPNIVVYCTHGLLNDKMWAYFDQNQFKMEEGDINERTFNHVDEDLFYYSLEEGLWFWKGYPKKWSTEHEFSHARDFLKEQLEYDTCVKQAGPGLLSCIESPPSVIMQIVTETTANALTWRILLCDKKGDPVSGGSFGPSAATIKSLLKADMNIHIQYVLKKDGEVLWQQEMSKELALKIIG